MPNVWTAVDDYLAPLVAEDDALREANAAAEAAGLPAIQVSAPQGRLLSLLARVHGARRALEVGTLAGYSTIWLARGLTGPDRHVTTIELDPRHAEVARANVARAGLGDVVDVRVGRGVDVLAQLEAEGVAPFDLVFIDADKQTYPDYYEEALVRTRRGGLILLDNVLASGYINAPDDQVPEGRRDSIAGLRAVNEKVAADERVDTAMVGIADGLMIARKR